MMLFVLIREAKGNIAAKVTGFNSEEETLKVAWMENGIEKTGSVELNRVKALGRNSIKEFPDLITKKYPKISREEIEKVIESLYRNPDKRWIRELTRVYNKQLSKINMHSIVENRRGQIGDINIRFVGRGEVSSGQVYKEFGQFPGTINDYVTSDVATAIGKDIILEQQLLYNEAELLDKIIKQYSTLELIQVFGGRANIPEDAIKMMTDQIKDLTITGF